MRSVLIVACAVLSVAMDASAQTPVSLSACSPIDHPQANRFVGAPPARARFVPRVTGAALLRVGHGIRFVGGLLPSANLAAQAGAIDPTIPAMAMVSGPRRGRVPVSLPVVDQSAGQPIRVECPSR